MTKRPEIIKFAKHNSLELLNDFVNLPAITGTEACLPAPDPDIFFSEFAVDIALAKSMCAVCPMVQSCLNYGMKHENNGIWGGLTPEERFALRGNKDAFDPNDIDRLLEEKDFIMQKTADEVAATYEVDTRTVARWRDSIRSAQKAS